MDLAESLHPFGPRADCRIGSVVEVPVPFLFRRVDDHRRRAVALHVRPPLRPPPIQLGQLLPQPARKPSRPGTHLLYSEPAARNNEPWKDRQCPKKQSQSHSPPRSSAAAPETPGPTSSSLTARLKFSDARARFRSVARSTASPSA